MRGRRVALALLLALFVALPLASNASTDTSHVVIASHVITHKSPASSRVTPFAATPIAALVALAAIAVVLDERRRSTATSDAVCVVAPRGPPS